MRTATSGTVVFRADASPDIGGGHVMRCLALADALAARGMSCAFACRPGTAQTVRALSRSGHEIFELDDDEGDDPAALAARWKDGVDWLVVDHYGCGEAFEAACRNWARNIMAIDDLLDRRHDCDFLLDQTLGATADQRRGMTPPDTTQLLGPQYALLRPEFAATGRRRKRAAVARVVVAVGMTDPDNLTCGVIETLGRAGLDARIDVVLGAAAPHLAAVRTAIEASAQDIHLHVEPAGIADLMNAADLAVGAGGGSAWERCALGLPSLVLCAAENQRQVYDSLISANAAAAFPTGGGEDSAVLEALVKDIGRLTAMGMAAAAICDGLGARRTAQAMAPNRAGDGQGIWLRPATHEDGEIMLQWQNDPVARRFANDPAPPTREEHFAWLAEKLADPDCAFNIILHGGKPAGVLRLDRETERQQGGASYRVSILISPQHYRLGIATEALALARWMMPDATFIAEVLDGNDASHALFRRAGFERRSGDYIAPAKSA